MSAPLDLFLIAGEPSGDRLGADLMRGLRQETGGAVRFHGLGGALMRAEGLDSLFPIDELSIMGVVEVLPKVPGLLRRIAQTADAVAAVRPAALITIDSPDFCLRVARKAKALRPDLPTIHYVAPSVWAWRPGRAAKMARVIDHVLALLPFEPPYMTAAGMTCDFVGHPVACEPGTDAAEMAVARQALGLSPEDRVLCLLPGSRRGEVDRHGPDFRAVADRLAARHPDLKFVLPTIGARRDQVTTLFAGSPAAPRILGPGDAPGGMGERFKRAVFAASTVALAVSGTVSVELAAAGTPMIVAYKANPVTVWVLRRKATTRYASLVNILLDRPVIPEYLFEACTPEALLAATDDLLSDADARRRQSDEFDAAMRMMGRGGPPPGLLAARSVLNAIG